RLRFHGAAKRDVAERRRGGAAVERPALPIAFALHEEIAEHDVARLVRAQLAETKLVDAAIVQTHRIRRLEGDRKPRRRAGRRRAYFDSRGTQAMHEEPSPRERLRFHDDIVDAHVEIEARN